MRIKLPFLFLFFALFLLIAPRAVVFAQVATGFDFPFGPPYGDPSGGGYTESGYRFLQFICLNSSCTLWQYHTGEDWNRRGTSGNGDRGDPVYSSATGSVTYSGNVGGCQGNTVLIRHPAPSGVYFTLPDGGTTSIVWTNYIHLDSRIVGIGGVSKGQQVGTIGTGNDCFSAHLHWEVRKADISANYDPTNKPKSEITARYVDPTDFVNRNRSLACPYSPGQDSSRWWLFQQAYDRNGRRGVLGCPTGSAYWWDAGGYPVVRQDFTGGSVSPAAILHDEGRDDPIGSLSVYMWWQG